MPRTQDFLDEPTMSDTTILVTLEDLINRAMGPSDANVVNFKLIQTILHILARQQRMLHQRVEIKIIEIRKDSTRKKHGDEESTEARSSTESPSPGKAKAHKSPQRGPKKEEKDMKDKVQQKDRADRKEHERDEKIKSKEKEGMTTPYKTKQMQLMVNKIEEEEEEEIIKKRKEHGTSVKMHQKEKEKMGQQESDKMSQKEKERWEQEDKKGHKEPGIISQNERERWEREEKMGQREPGKMSQKEKERWDKEEKIRFMEPDKMSQKEKERLEQDEKKRQKEPGKMSQKERERWERDEKMGLMEPDNISQKEREKQETVGHREPDKMSQKERENEEKVGQREPDKLSQKEREKEEKVGNREPDKMSQKERERWEEEEKNRLRDTDKISQKGRERWKKEEKVGQLELDEMSRKDRENEDKVGQREPDKMSQKEREKEDKVVHREPDKMLQKERERWEEEEKNRLREPDKFSQKERERWEKEEKLGQREPDKMSRKDRENEEKVGQRETDKMSQKERKQEKKVVHREPDKMSQKERERWEEEEKNRLREPDKISQKERERWEKEEKLGQREPDKMSQKEREKEEKVGHREPDKISQKERENEEKVGQRESDKLSQKEREKEEKVGHRELDKMTQKEGEKEEKVVHREPNKISQKERKIWEKGGQEKSEKITQKEKERLGREEIIEERDDIHKQKTGQDRSRSAKEQELDREKPAQRSSIEITEKLIDSEKILVVGRRAPTRKDAQSSSSIDVVTRSQFELLEDAVGQLRRVVNPQPLQMPDNKQLMSDVMNGTATLPDAMQALQIDAKLRAAEDAVVRMAGLLTQLAAAGELPDELLEQLEALQPAYAGLQAQADKSGQLVGKKSVAIDPRAAHSKASRAVGMGLHAVEQGTPDLSIASRPSAMSRSSRVSTSTTQGVPCVTHEELNAALKDLRDAILKSLNNMTTRASTSAENALHFAKGVADKLDVVLHLDEWISTLNSVVGDYAEQLNGFDSGLTTQMQSFQDQMAHMRTDLQTGLVQLENVNNNAETAAVLELTERFDELAGELDSTMHTHKALAALQAQLSGEMRNLVECMEMLREQKADRDEVLDGLRDKADTSRLAGLLSEVDFAEARADFERRIDLCHDKFTRQNEVWQTAIKELKGAMDKKAELVEMLSARDEAQRHLQELSDKIRLLAAALGEPKTALLTRKLAEGATCGSCHERALMEPYEAAHGAPRALPALRLPPMGAAEEPCIADLVAGDPTQDRHICHRWCGGSHTLLTEATRRALAPPAQLTGPTRKYQDYGDDGRLYMMEEECQPCVECNLLGEEKALEALPAHQGAGDMSPGREPPLECTCPQTD